MSIKIINDIKNFFNTSRLICIFSFMLFVVLMTATVSSQNFFYKSIIENGISKKDIVAPDGIGDVRGRVVMGKATTDFFVNGKNVVFVVGIHEVWLIYGGNLVAVFLITDGAILVCYSKVLLE